MATDEARVLYARRKELNEPTFGIIKEQMGARRFLLRGGLTSGPSLLCRRRLSTSEHGGGSGLLDDR